MTNAIFKTTGNYGYARAAVVMSTQSETVFEWSVKVLCDSGFRVGIASQLRQEANEIDGYDENAILYGTHNGGSSNPGITVGSNRIHSHPAQAKYGDVVNFRFQPQTKKFVVRLVRISKFSQTNFQVKNEHEYEIDLRDNVNYYAVVQSLSNAKPEALLLA